MNGLVIAREDLIKSCLTLVSIDIKCLEDNPMFGGRASEHLYNLRDRLDFILNAGYDAGITQEFAEEVIPELVYNTNQMHQIMFGHGVSKVADIEIKNVKSR